MKISPWIFIAMTTVLLSACGNADDRRSYTPEAVAEKSVAEIETAMDQANQALKAVEAANTDTQQALQRAKARQVAVEISMARLAKQSDMLKKEAENKARWAALMQQRAIAARQALLQAALEQSKAEKQVAEKEQAVHKARIQAEIHEDLARKAMLEKVAAQQLAAKIAKAEKLATLSLSRHSPLAAPIRSITTMDIASSDVKDSAQVILPKTAPKQKKTSNTKKPTRKAVATRTQKKPVEKVENAAAASKHPAEIKLASMPAELAADPVRGHGLAQKCQLCHSFEPNQKAKFGPELFGIVGQQAGKSRNYKYGSALSQASFTWNETTLSEWICNSGKTIKKLTGNKSARTKMPNQNTCGQNARDIVAYLSTLKAQASNPVQTNSL
ncbi:MAG: c-type cytochrome [Mariprofundus sp.]|nr:c-type cytochrome [Mariprofundus sp.]